MIKLNKTQTREIRDLLLIMDKVITINRNLFNISIEAGVKKHIKTLNKKTSP